MNFKIWHLGGSNEKLLVTETAVVKGFFSKILILEDKFLPQKTYLRNKHDLEKVEEV